MNAKTCKELRKTARAITVGRPERQLVQYANPNKSISAVNMPGTTRYVYRNLKTGRTIDPKRIVMEKVKNDTTHTTTAVEREVVKESFVQKAKTWFRTFLNKKFR